MEWLIKFTTAIVETLGNLFPLSPFRTIHLSVARDGFQSWWSVDYRDEKKIMILGADLLVSNLSKMDVHLKEVVLGKQTKIKATLITSNGHNNSLVLPANQAIVIHTRFEKYPVPIDNEDVYTDVIGVADQFSNYRWLTCKFKFSPF